jgi:protein-S-isoprenylcysteine O-methyltransferase Ste14
MPFRARVHVEAGVVTGAYADQSPMTRYRAVSGDRIWTWVTGGLGAASLVAAVVLGVIATTHEAAGEISMAEDWSLGSDLCLGGGVLLGIAAVVLYFVEGRSISTERTTSVQ